MTPLRQASLMQTNGIKARWVDFHCHLDLYPDHAALIAECDRLQVATLGVTTTPKAWTRNRAEAAGSRHVRVALGLHPQVAAEREGEVPLFEHFLPQARYVGEIGLDAGPRFVSTLDRQEWVFERILRACAEQDGKVITLHSVRAANRVLDHLERTRVLERNRAVLHWFTGTVTEAQRAVTMGCYFSINAQMLVSRRRPRHNHCDQCHESRRP